MRRQTWESLRDAGLSGIPSNTFSLYDQVLDTAVLFGAVPERFAGLKGDTGGLEQYFAMARGGDGVFDRHGIALAQGETAPVVRATWNTLRDAGLIEFYGGKADGGSGYGRLRLTAAAA